MKLSVIIVNYKVPQLLLQCLDSVAHSLLEFGADAEVWVVDNASNDGSEALVHQYFPTFQYLANTENLGFAKANNQAIRLAHGDYVLLLNPDTIIPESFLAEICAFADTATQFGAAGVRMINGRGQFLPESKRSLPTIHHALSKVIGNPFRRKKQGVDAWGAASYYYHQLGERDLGPAPILSGACMLLHKKVLGDLVYLDERYFMYGEDIDLSYSIHQAGFINYYVPLTILHYKGESTDFTNASYREHFYGAMALFYEKYHPQRYFQGWATAAIKLLCSLTQFKKPVAPAEDKRKEKVLNADRLTYAQIIKTIEQEGKDVHICIEHPRMGFTVKV